MSSFWTHAIFLLLSSKQGSCNAFVCMSQSLYHSTLSLRIHLSYAVTQTHRRLQIRLLIYLHNSLPICCILSMMITLLQLCQFQLFLIIWDGQNLDYTEAVHVKSMVPYYKIRNNALKYLFFTLSDGCREQLHPPISISRISGSNFLLKIETKRKGLVCLPPGS